MNEPVKITGRMAVLGAISTLVTYLIQLKVPNLPLTVLGAILTLVLVFADAVIHNSKLKLNGIVPF